MNVRRVKLNPHLPSNPYSACHCPRSSLPSFFAFSISPWPAIWGRYLLLRLTYTFVPAPAGKHGAMYVHTSFCLSRSFCSAHEVLLKLKKSLTRFLKKKKRMNGTTWVQESKPQLPRSNVPTLRKVTIICSAEMQADNYT